MFVFHGLNHVQLAAPRDGTEAARRFYGGILGLEELPKPPNLAARGGAWFRAGSIEIHVGLEDDFHPAKKAHPAFEVADLDRLRAHLDAQGVRTEEDELHPAFRRFYAYDPFGNRLEFMERK